MKRFRILALIFTVLALAVGICACDPTPAPGPGQDTPAQPGQETQNEYVITTDTELSYTLHVGDEVDFTQYFIVEDGNGNRIVVTEAMLDLSRVDLTKAGTFTVTLKIGDASKSAEFTVLAPAPGPSAEDTQKVTAALAAITDKTVEETTTLTTTADGVTLTWTLKTTDLPDGISVSGNKITVTARPEADTALKFTVKASLNGAEQTKDVTITVKAKPEEQGPSPEEVANATIAAAKEAIEQGKLGIQTVYTAVNTAGVALPAEYEGATLSWAASNSNYAKIANNKLTIPALPEGADATVTLTVTISCTHGTAQAVNLTITVKAKPGPTAEDVAKVNAALAAIKNQVIEETTTLNTTADGVTLTWTLKTAKLPDGITVSGNKITVITRPDADTALNFTVKASLNGAEESKDVTITVKAKPGPSAEDMQKVTEALATITDKTIEETTTLAATVGSVTLTWTLKTTLPLGISFSGNKITVTTRPNTDTALNFTVKASLNGAEQTKDVMITVKAKPGPSTEDVQKVTEALATITDKTIEETTTLAASVGDVTLTWTLKTTNLPVGISVNGNTITVTTRPDADTALKFTVKASLNGAEQSKDVTITVKAAQQTIPEKEGFNALTEAKEGTFKFAMNVSDTLYYATGLMSGIYYLETSENVADAADFVITKIGDNQYTITVGGKYLEVVPRTGTSTGVNIALNTTQTEGKYWQWIDGMKNFFMESTYNKTDDAEATDLYYLGTYSTYTTMSGNYIARIANMGPDGSYTGNGKEDVEQWVAHFGTYVGEVPPQGGDDEPTLPSGDLTLDFSSITETGTPIENGDATELFQGFTESDALTAAEVNIAYLGNGYGGGEYENKGGMIKMGTSSSEASLALTFSKKVTKVVILAKGWSATDTIAINGGETQTAAEKALLTFELGEGAQTITIATNKRALIFGIVVTFAEGDPLPEETNQAKVTAALAAVESTYEVSETGDYTLPVSTVDGVSFAWAVTSGSYQLTNSNTLYIQTLPAQDETVTLTLTASCGLASSTKSVTVIIKAETVTPPEPEKEGFNPITSPIAGTEYYMGMLAKDGAYHYLTGEMATGNASFYMATVTDINGATKVTLAGDATNGWTLKCANGKYIEIELNGTHINAVYKTTSSIKWTWDEAEQIFVWVNGSNKYFLGTHDALTTVGGVDYDKYVATNWLVVLGTYKAGGSGTDTPVTPSGTMEKQTYTPSTFDHKDMQEKYLGYNEAIGLPSTGTYNALVIPVQFTDELFTKEELQNLNLVFNGTSEQTGWESVQSYYKKSSYNQLNITFDIQSPYTTQNALSYYEQRYNDYMDAYNNGTLSDSTPASGEEVILLEALRWLDSNGVDLSKYDTNNDGFIDAVYLINSADIDYANAEFRWAYCTWYYGDEQFDQKDVYYYFFASIDFMLEKTPQGNPSYETIPGMKLNAETYVHESGHLLGLDDYYDYYTNKGSNQGLGGADMMDFNIGDHGVYSKIMLGWMEPTIVNETTTVTLKPSVSNASAILIPLNFNNSYFCEYLLIDLYSATGLNAMHSSYLYGGKQYGVRIYHASSSMSYDSQYGYHYFTYNNSDTSYPLIKLVEADGGNSKFTNNNGSAAASDLWKTGQKLSTVFPNYTRNDGKTLNFDVEIVSASAAEAQIRITFSN